MPPFYHYLSLPFKTFKLPFANIDVFKYIRNLWHIVRSVPRVVLDSITNKSRRYPSSADTKPSKKQSNVTTAECQPPRLFALIIGINEYKAVQRPFLNLKGAVPDANLVQSYLQKHLGVPNAHIRNLRDSEATRAAILHEINALITDDQIQRGDPILIFYAGLGSTAPTPKGWESGGPTIQLLLPHDYLCENEKAQKVHGIPDRTLGVLLGRLASSKGDNITVIFDCCHSGSGTRRTDEEVSEDSFLVRGIDTIEELPADLDRDISVSSRATEVLNGFAHSGLRSHVFLAACGAAEHAKEFDAKGLFTTALLSALVAWGTDIITYKDLLQLIQALPGQNPQCEGFFQTRVLFDGKISGHDRVLYNVRRVNNQYVMGAGAAHGITDGAQFGVYKDRDSKGTQLGTIVARKTDPFTTTLDIISDASCLLPEEGYALQTRVGLEEGLRLHVYTNAPPSLIETLQTTASQEFLLVEKEKAELCFTLEQEGVVVSILDSFVAALGLTRVPFYIEPNADAISNVIHAAAHFYFYLRQKSKIQALHGKIDVIFTEVVQSKEEYDDFLQPIIQPIGPNFNRENIIDLQIQNDKMYGMKIINNSDMALYPSFFFFDNSDLSITSYYQPPTSGAKVDPPLLPNSSVTIGYGVGGGVPYSYFLRENQDIDIGHLKLFLSTENVDLSHVPQRSPFVPHREVGAVTNKTTQIWDTILIPVVQRRM